MLVFAQAKPHIGGAQRRQRASILSAHERCIRVGQDRAVGVHGAVEAGLPHACHLQKVVEVRYTREKYVYFSVP